ncbi:MAG: polysaccharide deacetylase family protein [Myxococcota bacterium]
MSSPLTREASIGVDGLGGTEVAGSLATPFREAFRRWRPAPVLRATAALHIGGALTLAGLPSAWPWIAGTLIANHGLLLAGTVAPRSRLLGTNRTRLPEAAVRRRELALTFDDGPDPELTPRVLDLLDARGAKASFFCIGERAAAQPQLMREIVARGHAVESHSQRHSAAFALYGPWRLLREIEAAQRAITQACGSAPRFFRAPFGTRNPMLEPTLLRLGLSYVSWTRRGLDMVDRRAPRVLRRLLTGLAAGDVLLLHDGVLTRERAREATVLAVLPALLDELVDRGLRAVSLRAAWADEHGA